MKSGKAQKSLFSLMDIEDDNLDRLAKLTEKGSINIMLDKWSGNKSWNTKMKLVSIICMQ